MKKTFLFLFLCLCLAGCSQEISPSKGEIIAYVNANTALLETVIDDTIPTPPWGDEHAKYITEVLSDETIVKQVSRYGDDVIEFYCGGRGRSTGDITTGFYYASNNEPFALEFNDEILMEIEPGVYYWESEDGCHSFYTERICENWFYYLMKWL